MSIASGNNQTAAPHTPLAPIVLKVLDAQGYPVPGITVHFTDNGAGGSFAATSIITNSTGTATAQYTTGANTGKVIITSSTTGLKSLNVGVTVQ